METVAETILKLKSRTVELLAALASPPDFPLSQGSGSSNPNDPTHVAHMIYSVLQELCELGHRVSAIETWREISDVVDTVTQGFRATSIAVTQVAEIGAVVVAALEALYTKERIPSILHKVIIFRITFPQLFRLNLQHMLTFTPFSIIIVRTKNNWYFIFQGDPTILSSPASVSFFDRSPPSPLAEPTFTFLEVAEGSSSDSDPMGDSSEALIRVPVSTPVPPKDAPIIIDDFEETNAITIPEDMDVLYTPQKVLVLEHPTPASTELHAEECSRPTNLSPKTDNEVCLFLFQ
jgi:hypothetical protein